MNELYTKLSKNKKIIKKYSKNFNDEYLMIHPPNLSSHITIWKKPFIECEGIFHIAFKCPGQNKTFHEWLAVRNKKIVIPIECKYVNENITFQLPCPEIKDKYESDRGLLLDILLSLAT